MSTQNYVSTKEMSHEDWLKERKNFLGGSEIAAVLGLSKWKTARDIWNDKVIESVIITEENARMKAGKKLEPVVAEWYEEETGRKVLRDNKIRVHSIYPFLAANVDRIILPQNSEGRGILEIKTTSSFAHDCWEDEIPLEYYCQIQHYLDVTGYTWGEFAILINGWDFRIIPVKRDDDFIKIKNERLERFWVENVLRNIPPIPTTAEEIKEAYSSHTEGKIINASSAIYDQFKQLEEVKAKIEKLEEKENLIKISIQNEMQDAEKIFYDNVLLATWKKDNDSEIIDSKKLKAELPDIFKKYSKLKTGARKFIVKL